MSQEPLGRRVLGDPTLLAMILGNGFQNRNSRLRITVKDSSAGGFQFCFHRSDLNFLEPVDFARVCGKLVPAWCS
jgi:hypothetical protein